MCCATNQRQIVIPVCQEDRNICMDIKHCNTWYGTFFCYFILLLHDIYFQALVTSNFTNSGYLNIIIKINGDIL